ncbi:MAG: choice-of-anchor J domain-containing protein [Thermoplasmatales archaeon]|nr:choice-of-anchor J domain-containing protein [Thermoplasmatales archaeon]
MKGKRIGISACVVLFLLMTSINPVAYSFETITKDEVIKQPIRMKFDFIKPRLENVFLAGENYASVAMDLPKTGNAGEPEIPVKPVNVLLPYGTEVKEIKVNAGEPVLIGKAKLAPKLPPVKIGSDEIPEIEENEKIYKSSEVYPGYLYKEVTTQYMRGFPIVTINLYPVQWNPSTQELYLYPIMELVVELKDGQVNELFRGIEEDREIVTKTVDNPREVLTYPLNPSHSCEYVIITTEALKNTPGTYNFTTLMNSKIAKGMNATIVTVEWIYSNFAGVDNAEKIRNFIKWAYQEWHTQYVLLGGDADDGREVIPVRKLWVQTYAGGLTDYIPCDLYYACLDGSYNYDGDDKWGEPNDGEGGKEVDLRAEVYVGRAPVDNAVELANFVRKTLEYDTSEDSYLHNVLFCAEYIGGGGIADYGSSYKEEMRNGSNANGYYTVGIPGDEYNIITLYDSTTYTWSAGDLANVINSGIHIVNHLGHASYDNVMRFYIPDVIQLRNTRYFILYSQGCFAGEFTQDDCIGEELVTSEHGAFAVIMNANYGWATKRSTDGASQAYDREFFDAVYGENIREIGKANQDSKEDNLYRLQQNCMRWCYYELNLLGDPEIKIKQGFVHNNDVRAKSINEPKDGEIIATGTYTVNATIENTGLNNQNNFDVNLSIYKLTKVVHFYDDMESGSANWTVIDGNGDGHTWTISTARYNSPTHSFKCTDEASYRANANDSIISKPIDLSGLNHAMLEFWYWVDGEFYREYRDYGTIYLSDNNGSTWVQVKTNMLYTPFWQVWHVPIEAYVNLTNQVRIKFTFVSDAFNNSEGMYVDDVIVYSYDAQLVHYDEKTISLDSGKQTFVEFAPWSVSVEGLYAINVTVKLTEFEDEYPKNNYQNITVEVNDLADVGVETINYPTGTVNTGSHAVNATIKNFGNTHQTGINVNCSIYQIITEPTPTYTLVFGENKTIDLNAGEFEYVEFSPYNFATEGNYAINVSTSIAGDEDTTNDYKNITLEINDIYDAGVKSINYPTGIITTTKTHKVNATVKNYGTVPLSNVPVNCSIYQIINVINEGFEGAFPPAGWTNSGWNLRQNYEHGGGNNSIYSSASAGNKYLRTSGISLLNKKYILEFWMLRTATPNANQYVNISINQGGGWIKLLSIGYSTLNGMTRGKWYKFSIDLSPYAGSTVSIEFNHYATGSGATIHIDDVLLYYPELMFWEDRTINLNSGEEKPIEFSSVTFSESYYILNVTTNWTSPPDENAANNYKETTFEVRDIYDMGITKISYPVSVLPAGSYVVNVSVKNFGNVDQSSIPVNCSIYKINTVIINESFEGTWPPSGWANQGWSRSSAANHTGNYSASSSSSVINYYNLTTPAISLGSGNFLLDFWARKDGNNLGNGQYLHVDVGYTSTGPWVTLLDINYDILQGMLNNVWYKFTVDLSQYNGSTIYIRFQSRTAGVPSASAVRIDDIVIYSTNFVSGEDKTVNLNADEEKYIEFSSYNFAEEGDYLIVVKTNLLTDEIKGNDTSSIITKIWNIDDLGATSINYPTGTISVPSPPEIRAIATIKNFGNIPQSDFRVNCSIYKLISGTQLFFENFESGLPSGWTIVDGGTDDVYPGTSIPATWTDKDPGNKGAKDGCDGKFMIVDSDAFGSGTKYMDEQLITPELNFASQTGVILEFDHYYYHSSGSWGRVDIRVGSTANPWITIANFTSTTYGHMTYDISAYAAGQSRVWIRWYYNDSGTWAWYWEVDNIRLVGTPTYSYVFGDDEICALLNAGEETLIEFGSWSITTGAGNYLINVTTLLIGDEFQSNDYTTTIVFLQGVYDAEVKSINSPIQGIYLPGTSFKVNATVKNVGAANLTDVKVNCTIRNSTNAIVFGEEVIISSLMGNEERYVEFSDWSTLVEDVYRINVTVLVTGDENPDNDYKEILVDINNLYDVGVVSINYPTGTQFTGSYAVNATVMNFGNVPVGAFTVNCTIRNSTDAIVFTNEKSVSGLNVGQQTYVVFDPWTVSIEDTYKINVTTKLTNDEDNSNDYKEITVIINDIDDVGVTSINYPPAVAPTGSHAVNATVKNFGNVNKANVPVNCSIYQFNTLLFSEGFEESFPPVGWLNGGADGGWLRGQIYQHSGIWAAYSYAATGGDRYLVTPVISLGEGNYALVFWLLRLSRTALPGEYLHVDVGATQNGPWTTIFELDNSSISAMSSYTWYQFVADLTPYANQNIAIRFYHHSLSTSGATLYMDDISINTLNLVFGEEKIVSLINSYNTTYVQFSPCNFSTEGDYILVVKTLMSGDENILNNVKSSIVKICNFYDVGVSAINYPTPGIYQPGDYAVRATVKNYGTLSATFDVVCTIYGLGKVVVMQDDIESGENNWTHGITSGVDLWHISTRRYASQNHSWYCGNETTGQYENNMVDFLISPKLDLSDTTQALLKWKQWCNLESNRDYAYVCASPDNYTFYVIKRYTGSSGGWKEEEVDITSYINATTHKINIAFIFTSDSSGTLEGWYIDDVEITKIGMGSVIYSETLSVNNLVFMAEKEITFPPFTAEENSVYIINVTTLLAGDENPANDAKEATMSTYNEPPVTTCSCFGPLGCNNWYVGPVTISLSATDVPGVAYTRYRINGGAWQNYTSPVTVSTEGLYTVEYYSVDTLGSTEQVKSCTFGIAYSMPVTTCIIDGLLGENGWYTSDVTIKLVANAYICGVKETYYRIDGGSWQKYTAPITFSAEGTHTIEYYSVSNACITETPAKITTFKIDKTKPSVRVIYPNGGETLGGIITIRWTASDNIGIAGIDLLYSGDAGLTWNVIASNIPNTGSYNWNVAGLPYGSNYMVKVVAKDNAGNVASDTSDGTFTIGMPSPPTVSITKPRNALYIFDREIIPLPMPVIIGGITVEATASSSIGIAKVEFYIDGVLKFTDTSEPYSWLWDEFIIGTHEIKVIASDSIGQTAEERISVFIINF